MIPILTKGNKIKWKLPSMKLILLEETPIVEPKYRVSELTIHDAEFIYDNSNYKDFISIEYIIERITAQAKEVVLVYNLETAIPVNTFYTHRLFQYAKQLGKDDELVASILIEFDRMKQKPKS